MNRYSKIWHMCVIIAFVSIIPAFSDQTVIIMTPLGPFEVELSHAGPDGNLVQPGAPEPTSFTAPSMFSVPLPVGSGARALAVAGAFTALADDATAASWNPGGLVQLEAPEFSYVFRYTSERRQYESDDDAFSVSEDQYDTFSLNYASVVYPMYFLKRNWVASVNYQEIYDFKQRFHADDLDLASGDNFGSVTEYYTEETVENYDTGKVTMQVIKTVETEATSRFWQLMNSDVVSSLDFKQDGVIDAVSPALAVDITPKFSLGVTVNIYGGGMLSGQDVESRINATYEGYSDTRNMIRTDRYSEGTVAYTGVAHLTNSWMTNDIPFSGSTPVELFSDTEGTESSQSYFIDGEYAEVNTYEDLSGYNATFGMLWVVNNRLNLGAVLDLPWTAEGTLKKKVTNHTRTFDRSGQYLLDESNTTETSEKSFEYNFPMYWSVGLNYRWNTVCYSMLDVSRTHWSDFSFKVDGEERISPVNGGAYDQADVNDCWSVRLASEYVFMLQNTEIPIRGGVAWEQQPAIGTPDEYWSVSLGSGISITKGPVSCMIDLAYSYRWGNNVMGSLISSPEMTTDVEMHQVYLSNIWHF